MFNINQTFTVIIIEFIFIKPNNNILILLKVFIGRYVYAFP